MPQYRVIRSFGIPGRGLLGHVRGGEVVTLSDVQAAALNRPHGRRAPILEPYKGPQAPVLEAPQNAAIPEAPKRKRGRPRKARPGNEPPPAQDPAAASPVAGTAKPS